MNENLTVTQKELAKLLSISDRQVRNLLKDGVIKRDEDTDKIYAPDAIKQYYEFKFSPKLKEVKDLKVVQAEHEAVKKQIAEYRLAEIRNEMHSAKSVELCITGMLITFKNKILALPSKIAAKIIGLTNLNEITEIIDEELRESLFELSEYDPAMFESGGIDD